MREIFILGAGYGDQIQKHVDEDVEGHPLWISRFIKTNPDALRQTFLEYLNAGSDVINTLTYQASIPGFMKSFGIDEAASCELFKESVRIARRAIDEYMKANPNAKKPRIAGSVGSYGACLHDGSEYTGSFIDGINTRDLMEWHRPRFQALVQEGVDIIACETIPALAEAKALLTLAKEFPHQKVWISFQCKDGEHTAYGDDFKKAVRECWELNKEQLVAVGCNCVNPDYIVPLFSGINQPGKVEFPLIAYPNSGEDFTVEKGWHGADKWDHFDEKVEDWLNLGVTFLGSCCRTSIDYITRNKLAAKKWLQKNN